MDEENELVEMTATRRFGLKGESIKPGEKIMVPAKFEADGVPPVRWWQATQKAAINKEQEKNYLAVNADANRVAEGRAAAGAEDADS